MQNLAHAIQLLAPRMMLRLPLMDPSSPFDVPEDDSAGVLEVGPHIDQRKLLTLRLRFPFNLPPSIPMR